MTTDTSRWTVLSLTPLPRDLVASLFGDLPVDVVVPAERTPEAVRAAAADAEIVVGDWSGLRVDAELVAAAPRLALVQQPSVGVDAVDVAACAAAGIPVANAGGTNAVSVAEWCVGATFAVLRSLAWADEEVRAGRWPQLEVSARGGGELAGRRIGIVGMGRIGRECASRFVALGCDVAHTSRTRREPEDAGGARWMPLEDLLAHAQVLVIVVALAPETRRLIGTAELELLPAGAFVINGARGEIIDEAALAAALDSGHLAGAALDVYATEPLPEDSPLRDSDRILLSPHAAATTDEATGRLIAGLVDNVRAAVSGEPVVDVVNGVDPLIQRREA
ncbi:MAG TPA: NAD(P)-dependent oxidoreductase [Mycobacteriales bacterium]|nr:NAD(P)-dependent oxidoreductase [Mycobacteriales bacterium]